MFQKLVVVGARKLVGIGAGRNLGQNSHQSCFCKNKKNKQQSAMAPVSMVMLQSNVSAARRDVVAAWISGPR